SRGAQERSTSPESNVERQSSLMTVGPRGSPATSWRSGATEAGSSSSSASRERIQAPLASASAALRAAAKSSHQAKWATRAPSSAATAAESSVEPVSTTTSSSATGPTLARARRRFVASFFTIMQTVRRGRAASDTDRLLARSGRDQLVQDRARSGTTRIGQQRDLERVERLGDPVAAQEPEAEPLEELGPEAGRLTGQLRA